MPETIPPPPRLRIPLIWLILILMFLPRAEESAAAGDRPRQSHLALGTVGDSGKANRHVRRIGAHMVRLHHKSPLSAVLMLGDNLYGEEGFEVAVKRRFLRPFQGLLEQKVPFYATLGNHDNDNPDRWNRELNHPFFHMRGREYYAEELGGGLITIFVLQSEKIEDDPDQQAWFAREIAEHDSPWKILMVHNPLVGSEAGHGPSGRQYRTLKPVIEGEDGVQLVLSGHNHFYERRRIQNGILRVTLGSTGELDTEAVFAPDKNRAAAFNGSRCFGWIDVTPHELHIHIIDEYGVNGD